LHRFFKLEYHRLLSTFAFNFNLRSYSVGLKLTFSQQGGAAKQDMHAFFFYADCYHEVQEVGGRADSARHHVIDTHQ
jgi:hypothetical protein